MNVNPVTTSFSYKAASAFTGTTFLVFLANTTVCVSTILLNLTIVILKNIGYLDSAIKYRYIFNTDSRGHFFINRHMGACIATASLSLALSLIAYSALDNYERANTTQ